MIGKGSFVLGLLVLVMFCSPGGALRCFQCDSPIASCVKNVTCKTDQDACIQVVLISKLRLRKYSAEGGNYHYGCWKYADCNINKIGEFIKLPIAKYSCCQDDLCNAAGMGTPVSKTAVIVGLLVMLVGSFQI
ncbi:LOW QUALITY PROTEIN: CD59 glycoprotein [Dromiciops gliroides]|uniref:LOW QUALITY PROTEIN: CD59 glycoprotein n=1 Tax=Dromiciops gliroides TaxID=33562 RepID=UPI001CC66E70|nr:LOW QUALITY PROTEIN: CD59 glycoprotein [Dromiciops gliroides]